MFGPYAADAAVQRQGTAQCCGVASLPPWEQSLRGAEGYARARVALRLLVRHTIHECLQRWCPLGSVQPAGGMAKLALELKECCVDSSGLNFP